MWGEAFRGLTVSALIAAGLVLAKDAGPRPVHAAATPAAVDVPLPVPSISAVGHPYRWLRIGKLKYLEVLTGGATPDAPAPVAVMIHGLGDKPRIPIEAHPNEAPLRMLIPEGPFPFDLGRAWFPIRVRDDRPEAMAHALRQTTLELRDFLDEARERYRTPCLPRVFGFSQGGIVAWALSVRHPSAVDATLAMAAWLPPELVEDAIANLDRLPPIRLMHGDVDRIVPFEPTRAIVAELIERGADVRLEAVPGVAHRFTDSMNRVLTAFLDEGVSSCSREAERAAQ